MEVNKYAVCVIVVPKIGLVYIPSKEAVFVSPAKQKRDICTAFPVSSSLSSSSSAA